MERLKNLPVNFSVQQPGGLELTDTLSWAWFYTVEDNNKTFTLVSW